MNTQEHTWFARIVLIGCFVLALFSLNEGESKDQDSFNSTTEYVVQKDNFAVLAEIVPSPDFNPSLVSKLLITKNDIQNTFSKSISNGINTSNLKIEKDRFLKIKKHLSCINQYRLHSSNDDEDLIS